MAVSNDNDSSKPLFSIFGGTGNAEHRLGEVAKKLIHDAVRSCYITNIITVVLGGKRRGEAVVFVEEHTISLQAFDARFPINR